MEEKNFFEDFTNLRWVKWTKRQPEYNGSVIIRWNGKYTSYANVNKGNLMSIDDDAANYHMEDGKIVMDYTEEQKSILEDVYWLEEIHDMEAFDKYRDQLYAEG